jgi:hypothetical protein
MTPCYVTKGRLTEEEFSRIEEYINSPKDPEEPQLADRYLRMMYQEWRATQWERHEAQDNLQTTPSAMWIAIEERLPETEGCYLVCVGGIVQPARFNRIEKPYHWADFDISEVTHWMPLPKRPKEEN